MSLNISVEQLKLESTMGRTLAERSEMIMMLHKQLGDALTENAALKTRNEQLQKSLDEITAKKEK